MNNDFDSNPTSEDKNRLIDDPNPFTNRPTVKISEALELPAEDKKINTVRTFQSDVAGAIQTDSISMIKIALAEKERRETNNSQKDSEIKTKTGLVYILAFLITVVVFGAVGFVYYYFNRPPAPTLEQVIAPLEPEIIYSEIQVVINTDDKTPLTLFSEIKNNALEEIDIGIIKRILLTTDNASSTRNISIQEFFILTRSQVPDDLIRALKPYFVIGAYSFKPNDIFIVLKVNSYDLAYASMLKWEPFIESDIGSMFNFEKNTVTKNAEIPKNTKMTTLEEDTTSTSTQNIIVTPTSTTINGNSSTTNISPNNTTRDKDLAIFIDKILQNKDTRALVSPNGKIKLLYSFLDKETLVITTSEIGLKEILYRTTTGRIVR